MSRVTLLSLQLLVAVVASRLWQFLATVPVFGQILLPPFFFSNPVDVVQPDRQMVLDRRDLEASLHHADRNRFWPS